MSPADFRKELTKLMPGYQWTVHRAHDPDKCIKATGIQSSGFNRLSTLVVTRAVRADHASYEVRSAGRGKRSPWLHTANDVTLARALRALQNHYEHMASLYAYHAADLQRGRKPRPNDLAAKTEAAEKFAADVIEVLGGGA